MGAFRWTKRWDSVSLRLVSGLNSVPERNVCSVHVDNPYPCGCSELMESSMGLAGMSQDLWQTCLKQQYWEVCLKVTESYSDGKSFLFCYYLFLKHVKEKNSIPRSLGNVNQLKKCWIFMEGIGQNVEDMKNVGMNTVWGTKHFILIICGKTGPIYVLIFLLHCPSALYTGLTWKRPRATQNTIPFLPTKKADCRLQFKKVFFSSNSYRKQILQGACQSSYNIVKGSFPTYP